MSYITEDNKIFRIVLSKPEKNLEKLMETAGKNLLACISENPAAANEPVKLKISPENSENRLFFAELYTKTQVFHKHLKKSEVCGVLESLVSSVFKNAEIETENENITVLTGKKGNVSVLKKSRLKSPVQTICRPSSLSREKNYIIKEGKPVRFLVELGIMTKDGKVHSQKYGKFRQINRFLEFAADLLPETDSEETAGNGRPRTFSIIDFGCGKSYLTFALYYYLSEIKKIPVEITGIDLKKDVISFCSSLAEKCGYKGLKFFCGDIEDWYRNRTPAASEASVSPDLVVTLHACNTATDYALAFAVKHCAKAILSVPCCQHELNQSTSKDIPDTGISAMFKYGIIKERFCALATDTLRAELLSGCGYSTQLLEFTDADDTPKNLLIRAVRADSAKNGNYTLTEGFSNLKASLGKSITLEKLLFEN